MLTTMKQDSSHSILLTRVLGAAVVIIGLYLLLSLVVNAPFVGALVRYWPLTLVGVGLIMVFGMKGKETSGLIITLVGLLIVGNRAGFFDSTLGQVLSDVTILLLGVVILVGFASSKKAPTKVEKTKE